MAIPFNFGVLGESKIWKVEEGQLSYIVNARYHCDLQRKEPISLQMSTIRVLSELEYNRASGMVIISDIHATRGVVAFAGTWTPCRSPMSPL